MERRRQPRFARRLQVRFWMRGETTQYSGYTANISTTGMFVGTSTPLPTKSRVRIEVLAGKDSFMIEGMVAHSARVSPLLKKLRVSGMGVRFLQVHELVAELIPSGAVPLPEPGVPAAVREASAEEAEAEEPVAVAAEEAEEPTEPEEAEPAAEPEEAAGPEQESPEEETAKKEAPAAAGPPPVRDSAFPVVFTTLPQFLSVFKKDIQNGGVFVPTQEPAPLDARVTVELHIPPPVDRVVRAGARVVHRTSPKAGETNLLAGMGIAFSDPEAVTKRIKELIYRT